MIDMTIISLLNLEGPFGSMGTGGGAMIASSLTTPEWPDMYFSLFPMDTSQGSAAGLEQIFGVETGVVQEYYKSAEGKDAFSVVATLARPISRGEVKLRSKDPFDTLIIDPKYFDVPEDVQVMVEGMKFYD